MVDRKFVMCTTYDFLEYITFFILHCMFFILLTITAFMENEVWLSEVLHLSLNDHLKPKSGTIISGKPKTFSTCTECLNYYYCLAIPRSFMKGNYWELSYFHGHLTFHLFYLTNTYVVFTTGQVLF